MYVYSQKYTLSTVEEADLTPDQWSWGVNEEAFGHDDQHTVPLDEHVETVIEDPPVIGM